MSYPWTQSITQGVTIKEAVLTEINTVNNYIVNTNCPNHYGTVKNSYLISYNNGVALNGSHNITVKSIYNNVHYASVKSSHTSSGNSTQCYSNLTGAT